MPLNTFTLTTWKPTGPFTGTSRLTRRNTRRFHISGFSASAAAASSDGEPQDDGISGGGGSVPTSGWSLPARNWPLLIRTFAVHAVHIAARAISQPLQPVLDRAQERASASSAIQAACDAFKVETISQLQDVSNSLILSECVYKVVGRPEGEALRFMSGLKAAFPPGIVTLATVQFARPHVRHRFAVAESNDAMYVAFMGTKLARDFLANITVWHDEVLLDASVLSTDDAEGVAPPGSVGISGVSSSAGSNVPAAHKGFLTRARGIPLDALFHEAQRKGKRLIFTGHSLGGAVATLCTIKLLQRLPPDQHGLISCVGFATPALGNECLHALVTENGWDKRIKNYLVPEDPIPGLLGAGQASRSNGGNTMNNTNGNVVPESSLDVQDRANGAGGNGLSVARQDESMMVTSHIGAEQEREPDSSTTSGTPNGGGGTANVLRRSISRGTIRVLNAVAGPPMKATGSLLRVPVDIATTPFKAATQFLTLGQQLYIFEDAVRSERPPLSAPPPLRKRTSSGALGGSQASFVEDLASSSATAVEESQADLSSSAPPSDSVGGQDLATNEQQDKPWWQSWPRPFAAASSSLFLQQGEGDDDNVDVAAAAAAAGAQIPDRLPARTLFPMHRMLTYRTRLLNICQDALSGHTWPVSLIPNVLPHLYNFPHPDDVAPSDMLAPQMFPIKAEGVVAGAQPLEFAHLESNHPHYGEQKSLLKPSAAATRRGLGWPLKRLLGRPGKAQDTTPMEVIVRVEGKGLYNVTDAWVSGARVDANGRSTPVPVEILSKPNAPPVHSVKKKGSPLMEPISALASWVAMAVGWIAVLRHLQKPSSSDYLTAKVKLPACVVQKAQKAAIDPLAVAVGENPRLMVHLQSDFSVQSVPLPLAPLHDIDGHLEGRTWSWWRQSKEDGSGVSRSGDEDEAGQKDGSKNSNNKGKSLAYKS